MLLNLQECARISWKIAAWEAEKASHHYIEKEHILIGICSLDKILDFSKKGGANAEDLYNIENARANIEEILNCFELNPAVLRRQLRKELGKGDHKHPDKIIHRSEECKKIFSYAEKIAGQDQISCLDLLSAIMEYPSDLIKNVLLNNKVKIDDLKQKALDYTKRQQRSNGHLMNTEMNKHVGTAHFLNQYGRDLTCEAIEGKLGPFVGRRNELLQVIQTMARRKKNNPVLVGEPGVGKTAIVEALALRVVQGKDPRVLRGKRIIELNVGRLVGDTKYRGDFEKRINSIISEVREHPEVVVFIDEIHNVIGAGRAEGSIDAANLLKPALSRGEFRCIGATTIAEYRRYIESDPALERRFEKIIVNEPSPEETLKILHGIKPKLEKHHNVMIEEKALEAAIELSIRFDGDHNLPDKAIDLVDKAGARINVPYLSMIYDTQKDFTESPVDNNLGSVVSEVTVSKVLAEKLGLPLEIVRGSLESEAGYRLLELETYLKTNLYGQDIAVERLCERLIMSYSDLESRRGPIGVFLFLGPTGVGKTELAKLLSQFLFGSNKNMIRFDMSEFMEEHTVAKLIGSPPGYIGYNEEGQLTGRLRTKPYSVVLLDEIEKAHNRILDIFLQVFDEGRITDSKGRQIDARNAIFIMTSNIRLDAKSTPPIYGDRKNRGGIRQRLQAFMKKVGGISL